MQKTISRITDYIVQVADPDKIMLFGSIARGTYNQYSDIDLLIISDEKPTKDQISKIKTFINELSVSADILIHSQSEIDVAVKISHSFLAGILKNAKTVYEKK